MMRGEVTVWEVDIACMEKKLQNQRRKELEKIFQHFLTMSSSMTVLRIKQQICLFHFSYMQEKVRKDQQKKKKNTLATPNKVYNKNISVSTVFE